MHPKLNAAVVGCGIGKSHMLAFQKVPEQFHLAAICDLDAAKTQALADELKVPKTYNSLDALCADPGIDVIDLATPPHLHLAQIQQVLAAGKHVICEKPLVPSLRDVDFLIDVEKRSGKRILPIFQYRYEKIHVAQRRHQRLFANDVLARGEHLLDLREVQVRRRGEVDDVDAGIGAERVEGVVGFGDF